MNNPATPGSYDFTYVSYYNDSERSDPSNDAKIDEDLILSIDFQGT